MSEAAHNSENQYGLVALKPDALERDLGEEVYERLEDEGIEVVKTKKKQLSREDVAELWGHVGAKDIDNNVVWGIHNYLEGETVEAAVVKYSEEDSDIFEKLEETIGDKPHPEKNDKDTIRGATVQNPTSEFFATGEERRKYLVYESHGPGTVDRTGGEGVRNLAHFAEEDELSRDLNVFDFENYSEIISQT